MRCTYQVRLTKYNYDQSPRRYEDCCVLNFVASIPCALRQDDEVEGLPVLNSALVSYCIWSHKNATLCIKLKDVEYETNTQLAEVKKSMVNAGWEVIRESVVVHHKGNPSGS